MYAVIRAGGKQYKVSPGDVIRIEKMTGTDGQVQFGDVLAVSSEAGSVVRPGSGASVTGVTAVRITEIAFDGQSFKAPELPQKQKKVKKKAAEGGEAKAAGSATHAKKRATGRKTAAKKK